MKGQVSVGRRRKGEQRRDVRDYAESLTLRASHEADAVVLSRLFRVLFQGVGGVPRLGAWLAKETRRLDRATKVAGKSKPHRVSTCTNPSCLHPTCVAIEGGGRA